MTRIKYFQMNNILVTNWFTIRPNYIIRGHIDLSNNTYKIQELDSTDSTIGIARNTRIAKSRVRQLLIDYGVKLSNEVRKHTTP